MDHPEKALFDEIRNLRTDLEQSKERIFKLEKDYEQKVELLELRNEISERTQTKVDDWLNKTKDRITLIVNNKQFNFLKSTFTENIYSCNNQLLPNNQDTVILDVNEKFFKELLKIISKGHSLYSSLNRTANNNNSSELKKNIKDSSNFSKFIEQFFCKEIYHQISLDFELNYTYLGDSTEGRLFGDYDIDKVYSNNTKDYMLQNVKSLGNKKNTKAFFLDYNGNLDIELTETIRVKTIYVRSFTNSSVFSSTNGANYASLYLSNDGYNYEFISKMPSTYGSNMSDYISEIFLNNLTNFRYLRFKTDSSSMFSISYLSFTK